MKWLLFALICALLAIVVMVVGLFKYKKISNKASENEEDKQKNLQLAQREFFKYVAIATTLIVVSIIIRFTTNGTVV